MQETPRFDADALAALAAFLPEFEAPEFRFGEWDAPKRGKNGVIELGGFNISSVAEDFLRTCEELGWVQWPHFDWVTWMSSPEARGLRDDPLTIERASAEQLSRLLTVLIRGERFSEGSLGAASESGLLVRILRRIATLATSTSA